MCEVAEYTVFLDLAKDKYTALPPESTRDLQTIRSMCDARSIGPLRVTDSNQELDSLLIELQAAGLLVSEESEGKPFSPLHFELPDNSLRLQERPLQDASLRYWIRFQIARLSALTMLKLFPLKSTVAHVRERKIKRSARKMEDTSGDMRRLAFLCTTLQPTSLAGKDACLRDSLTLIEFLGMFGLYPDWVFGVSMPPFHAHSWVQCGTTVLNDSVHHVRCFVPMMKV